MSKIYETNDKLRLTVTTNINITDALVTLIKYKKPDGTTGAYTALVSDAVNGVIYYDLPTDGELDMEGTWHFWAFVTFSDGRSAAGEVHKHVIYEEGAE